MSWNGIYLIYVPQFGLEISFTIFFLPLKESHFAPNMDLFYYTFTNFVPIGVIENRVTKINSKYFNGKL